MVTSAALEGRCTNPKPPKPDLACDLPQGTETMFFDVAAEMPVCASVCADTIHHVTQQSGINVLHMVTTLEPRNQKRSRFLTWCVPTKNEKWRTFSCKRELVADTSP